MALLSRTAIALVLAALSSATLAACGESDADLLPGETAREITANLDAVKQLADEGDCVGAESAAQQVGEQIEALGGVDRRLKEALSDGAVRLNEVVGECEETTTEAIAPAEPPTDEENDEEEKEERKAEKEREKEERDEEKADAEEEPDRELPPQAKGEGKGLEDGEGETPPSSEGEGEEAPSGGVSPGSAVGEGD